MKLKLNQKVILNKKSHTVIGIDTYLMKNFLGANTGWVSYTLIDDNGNKTWVSYGTAGKYFTQWNIIPKDELISKAIGKFNFELSGIAHVKFSGNQGYSTPYSEIVWFDIQDSDYDYVSIERFLEQKDDKIIPTKSYYQSGKILKNFRP